MLLINCYIKQGRVHLPCFFYIYWLRMATGKIILPSAPATVMKYKSFARFISLRHDTPTTT